MSRTFFEVMSLLSADYASLFKQERSRLDKHNRAHDLFAVTDAVRVGRRVQEAQARLRRSQRRAVPVPEDDAPAQVFDAGTHFIVSARSQAKMQDAVHKLAGEGCQLLSPMAQVGCKWVASVGNPRLTVQAKVETLGYKRVITGPTVEAVRLKLQDLLERGAVLVQDAELADGIWTAVCEKT